MRKTIKKVIENPRLILLWSMGWVFPKLFWWLPDRSYLKVAYFIRMGKRLNLDNPQTYNEKLQYLLLHDRKPEYREMVDKATAKEWAARIIGEQHIIPTLGVYDKFDDIDFDTLPDKFVLKCTHDSGGVVICSDKSAFDMKAARKRLNYRQRRNYYRVSRAWCYKDIVPRIIAEKYVEHMGGGIPDYKFFCFNGEVKFMFIATERQGSEETKFDFYDLDFNHLPFLNGHPNSAHVLKRPKMWDEMISISKKLSANLPHVRVDLYEIDGSIYFGEMTFFHFSGKVPFEPEEWDYKFGEYIDLRTIPQLTNSK